MVKPFILTVDNLAPGAGFDYYELHSVRSWRHHDGSFEEQCETEEDMDPEAEEADGPPFVTLFGHLKPTPDEGGLDTIKDFMTVDEAVKFLERLNGPLLAPATKYVRAWKEQAC